MKKRFIDNYSIELFSLSEKVYDFEFPVTKELFSHFENDDINDVSGSCKVVLDKRATMIRLYFYVDVKVLLTCDRSLDTFWSDMSCEKEMLLKYGEEYKEIDDEVVFITPEQLKINVGQWIYEILAVRIPMKKLHPRFDDEEDSEEDSFFYSDSSSIDNEEYKKSADPRWDALRDLNIDDN